MADIAPLHVTRAATAANVGRLRRELRRWLDHALPGDPDSVTDLVQAASEALENAADHAFVDRPACGSMTVAAHIERRGAECTVVVVVSDDGRWKQPDPHPRHRGRGLGLIERLTADHVVSSGRDGTAVTLLHRS